MTTRGDKILRAVAIATIVVGMWLVMLGVMM